MASFLYSVVEFGWVGEWVGQTSLIVFELTLSKLVDTSRPSPAAQNTRQGSASLQGRVWPLQGNNKFKKGNNNDDLMTLLLYLE